MSFIEEFWKRVDVRGPDECWPWLLKPNHAGYGMFQYCRPDGRKTGSPAHVIALILVTGENVNGRYGLHAACPNKICCNVGPKHAYWGTLSRTDLHRTQLLEEAHA